MKKWISVLLIAALMCALLSGCGENKTESETEKGKGIKIGMVVDREQVTADPFQYAVWKGLEKFEKKHEDVWIKYLESETEEEYLSNFDWLADEGSSLVIGSGFQLADAIQEAARLNKDVHYVLLDHTFGEKELADNLMGIDFASEISAFLAGYIAANATETGKVGFIGGISSAPLDRFEYGYRYGVAYAGKELGKELEITCEYTDTFQEPLEGKNLAKELYEDDCDVIFQAAGESGLGVIEEAKLKDKWVIGVDSDQYEEAPDNVLTSALKYMDQAAQEVAEKYLAGEKTGGVNELYGLSEDAVGIPKKNPNLNKNYPGLYKKAMKLQDEIEKGAITVPKDKDTFDTLMEQL